MATTKDLVGRRVRVGEVFGQLTGWNQATGRVWVFDEEAGYERVVEGETPELALRTCTSCGKQVNKLFPDAWDENDQTPKLCVEESRVRAQNTKRNQTCDRCGKGYAYRNAVDRLNLYLCSYCHGERMKEEGIPLQQNKWFPRISQPLNIREREVCFAKGAATQCKGEVRPRGKGQMPLCNAHAGRVSAADAYEGRG